MTQKEKAEKKIEIVIDKLVDLLDICGSGIRYKISEALEKVRNIEYDISNGELKNGEIN